jgi:hypothetical protein
MADHGDQLFRLYPTFQKPREAVSRQVIEGRRRNLGWPKYDFRIELHVSDGRQHAFGGLSLAMQNHDVRKRGRHQFDQPPGIGYARQGKKFRMRIKTLAEANRTGWFIGTQEHAIFFSMWHKNFHFL